MKQVLLINREKKQFTVFSMPDGTAKAKLVETTIPEGYHPIKRKSLYTFGHLHNISELDVYLELSDDAIKESWEIFKEGVFDAKRY